MQRMDREKFRGWLEERTKSFAVATFRLLDALPKKNSTRVIAYQLGKSSSSVGANYREANRGESGDDFRHKLAIAVKEASESAYWFEVLSGLYPMHKTIAELRDEAVELRNLLQSINSSSHARKRRGVALSD